jgi:hypothetical protein
LIPKREALVGIVSEQAGLTRSLGVEAEMTDSESSEVAFRIIGAKMKPGNRQDLTL